MSLECSECERDLRGGHDPACPLHPDKKLHDEVVRLRARITELEWQHALLRQDCRELGDALSAAEEACAGLRKVVEGREKRIAELEAEAADYQRVFALQLARMGEATEAWRAAHPGNGLVWPDLGDLLAWLLAERGRPA